MKRKKIVTTGTIDQSGHLHAYMCEANEALAEWKGRKVIITLDILEEGTTHSQRAYYYNYILPTIKEVFKEQGNRMTELDVDMYLRKTMTSSRKCTFDDQGNADVQLKAITTMDKAEMSEFIDEIKQFAAEELSVYIEEGSMI